MEHTEGFVQPLVKDYQILVGYGTFITRQANKLIQKAMFVLAMMEDK